MIRNYNKLWRGPSISPSGWSALRSTLPTSLSKPLKPKTLKIMWVPIIHSICRSWCDGESLFFQVRWMMYWIVYAIFAAVESIMDPILYFWWVQPAINISLFVNWFISIGCPSTPKLKYYSSFTSYLLLPEDPPQSTGWNPWFTCSFWWSWYWHRYWIHPTLCSNEAQIDVTITKFKSRTVQTLKQWVSTGLQRLGEYLQYTIQYTIYNI